MKPRDSERGKATFSRGEHSVTQPPDPCLVHAETISLNKVREIGPCDSFLISVQIGELEARPRGVALVRFHFALKIDVVHKHACLLGIVQPCHLAELQQIYRLVVAHIGADELPSAERERANRALENIVIKAQRL